MSVVKDVLGRFVLTRRFFQTKPVPYKPIQTPVGKGIRTESHVAKKTREEDPLKRQQIEEGAMYQLLREAKARQASQQASEGTTPKSQEKQAVTAPERQKATTEGKARIPVGAGDSESRG